MTAVVTDADDGTDRAAFALLQAQASQIKQTLTKTPSGYALSRWGQMRHCSTIVEVVRVLRQMGARL